MWFLNSYNPHVGPVDGSKNLQVARLHAFKGGNGSCWTVADEDAFKEGAVKGGAGL